MSQSQSLLPEFDQEMANTRRVLERVPDEHLDWAPHPKSYTLGQLAAHVALLPAWGAMTLSRDEFDMAPPDGARWTPPVLNNRAEMLAAFDKEAAGARQALEAATDADLARAWSLKQAGQTVFSLPKSAVFRTFVMNHLVHHRGQLMVYLRLKDVPVPGVYGPSADEPR